jgi:2-dehydropantoate 2-reductase
MSGEKATRYVIFGAGAIGCAVGGMLVRAGVRVKFVARQSRAEAIRRGVIMKQDGEEKSFKAEAVTAAHEIAPESGDVVLLTTKSQSTEVAVAELAAVYDRSAPVVCLQNGVRNEEIAARRFDNVYAGLVFIGATQLSPGLVTIPGGGAIAVGRCPGEVDDTARRICNDLARAGLKAMASAYVMAMKWGKLVANLNNATHTITDYWVELGLADPDMRELTLRVREEGLRVLDAAGIDVEPPEGEPSPIRIRKMTEELKRPPRPGADPARLPEEERTYASMWQDLKLGRKSHEAEFLNGDIVELGRKLGMSTPYNSTLLEVINDMFARGLEPGIYTPAELHALIRARGGGQA